MPTVPFTFLALVWRRERDGPCLAELLFFPEISRVAASPRAAVDALKENLPGLVKQADPARLHACRLPPDLRHEQVEGLDALRWSAPNGIEVHYLPDLRLEIVSQGDSNVEREIAAHLARTGVPGPEALARRRRLEIVRFEMDVEIPTPLERAAAQARDEKPTHDAITDLGLQPPAEAFERDREVLAVVDALEGRASRSVLLVGPPGVGKTAIAREASRHARAPFWETSGPRLVAGMSGFGMWQERCQDLVREARRGGAVLLLGNLVELSQAGRYKGDASGVAAFFRPLLARGDVLAIVEATPTQISLLEREDPRLLEAFQRVDVKEPDPVACRAILRKSSPGLSDEILEVVERLHRRYGSYSAWPGRPLRFVRNLEGLDAVEVFSTETGIPRGLLDDRVPFDLEQARATLAESVVGQPEAVDLVVDLIATLKAGLVRPGRPIASLLFVGPTGVGKTQLAKALAGLLFGDPRRMIRFDMSEYADPPAVGRLVGGWGGAEGLLVTRVREQPFSVLLFDEFEKADAAFFDLLLQVLGDARLTDGAGRVADFRNCVIIMTSNLGAASFQRGPLGFVPDRATGDAARRHFVHEVRAWLRPELYNRIDRLVPFSPLDRETVTRIAARELETLYRRDGIRHRDVTLRVGDEVAGWLGEVGWDPRYGARPLKRAVERAVLAPLARGLNAYAATLPLDALLEKEGKVTVRARASDSEGPAVATAARCSALRRHAARLVRGGAAQELQDDLYRAQPSGGAPARVPRLHAVLGALEALVEDAEALETDVLLDFFESKPVAPDLDALERRIADASLALFALRYERPDLATVGIFTRNAEALEILVEAYVADGAAFSLQWSGWRAAERIPANGDLKHFLENRPKGLIGISLHFRGPLAWPRYQSEMGAHVLEWRSGTVADVLIHTADATAESYAPPEDAHRQSAVQGLERRRTWLLDDRRVEDHALRETANWVDRGIARTLSALVERRMRLTVQEALQ